ncbi:MAG: hypothetical protein IJS47_06310 [Clostridia bacterium]|nr:hypothetical protein [Clostridia bacterium]
MFYFLFGAIWTFVSAILAIAFFSIPEAPFWCKLMLAFFLVIGIIMLAIGIKKFITDKLTDKKGEECYGRLIKVYPSGTYINGQPELKADFAVLLPIENQVEIISEVIGMSDYKFPLGSYWKLKHYNGDINILNQVSKDELPYGTTDAINAYSIVEIDGTKYKRID